MSSSGTVEATPTGYTLIIPPGWARIPLREGTKEALEQIFFTHLDKVPDGVARDDAMRLRLELRRQLEKKARAARRNGGLDLYLPVSPRKGTVVAASFIVSELPIGGAGQAQAKHVLKRLAANSAGPGVTTRELSGSTAVRREDRVAAEPGRELDVDTRRVEYVMPVAGNSGNWLSISFSTPGDGNLDSDFTDVLIELFDAVVGTFKWRYE
ncbi:hypothetical protein [Streptomyces ochraceiscleroticus]|uniref:Uncharacterized protein n=1 Tax=Streptomyces ochraceiscleroticus TaxID=47761 RepID=A0ABW1MES2_9ACTN|nr:hypothetical protein [Streptomyces ochraceiscleroticus]